MKSLWSWTIQAFIYVTVVIADTIFCNSGSCWKYEGSFWKCLPSWFTHSCSKKDWKMSYLVRRQRSEVPLILIVDMDRLIYFFLTFLRITEFPWQQRILQTLPGRNPLLQIDKEMMVTFVYRGSKLAAQTSLHTHHDTPFKVWEGENQSNTSCTSKWIRSCMQTGSDGTLFTFNVCTHAAHLYGYFQYAKWPETLSPQQRRKQEDYNGTSLSELSIINLYNLYTSFKAKTLVLHLLWPHLITECSESCVQSIQ